MDRAKRTGSHLLIEATCNQVNQFGGYTGLTPQAFLNYTQDLASQTGFPPDQLILGGDHLGPSVWQGEPPDQAMAKAEDLMRAYVAAGFSKIHLDASMSCQGDPIPLPDTTVAERAARLCRVAEETSGGAGSQVYVIGTEVPVPGGTHETLDELQVTTPDEVAMTISNARSSFEALGLERAWERVIAVVVQPGVEFGTDSVVNYRREAAVDLSRTIEQYPGLVYEAHSTDYQPGSALRELVEDHFCILKVGPWLTFAFREAVFALAMIEDELSKGRSQHTVSSLLNVIESTMLTQPQYWKKYYEGDEAEQRLQRRFSLSDRIRYYWSNPEISHALEAMLKNLTSIDIPLTLVSQYLPQQYEAIRRGEIDCSPQVLIRHRIQEVLNLYGSACGESS